MKKKILFIRTFKAVGLGGSVPPLELLYIASNLFKAFNGECELKILDTGLGNLTLEDMAGEIKHFNPRIICLNGLVWEADIIHHIAAVSKRLDKNIIILVEGQLANLAREYLLKDKNIDFVVTEEADITVAELIKHIGDRKGLIATEGIIFREGEEIISNNARPYIENLDDFMISPAAWKLIDFRKYSNYPSWNGSLKEKFYIPILTSRGCPFECTFCCNRNILGSIFRMRSPENVLAEIKFLQDKYGVKEIHIFDSVFNFDIERAKKICQLIIDSKIKLSIAFPHGIRADMMTEELLRLLRKAGVYKITYGVETASPRLQKTARKNLDLDKVKEIIRKTQESGIIVSGYFILGFPTETYEEMQQTIDFANNSELDLAYFFKFTRFEDIKNIYESMPDSNNFDISALSACGRLCYYATERSCSSVSASALNDLLLKGQQKFYLNRRRLWRGLIKSPHKIIFLKNLINLLSLLLQACLIMKVSKNSTTKND